MAVLKYKDPNSNTYKSDIRVVGAVSSVNGETGVINLDAEKIQYDPDAEHVDGSVGEALASRPTGVFVAEYNETTFDEVKEAFDTGEALFVHIETLGTNAYLSMTHTNKTTFFDFYAYVQEDVVAKVIVRQTTGWDYNIQFVTAETIQYDSSLSEHTAGSVGAKLSEHSSAIVNKIDYVEEQTLTDDQKVFVCQKIGAVYGGHINSYEQIQRIVRAGNAETYFPIGTQISVENTTIGDVLFDVVSHEKIINPATGQQTPAMSLLMHYAIYGRQFDAAEAFYYAETALAAGTYNFTIGTTYNSWTAGTYQFTLSSQLPAGGQLCLSGNAGTALSSLKVDAYASQTTTTKSESVTIASGNSGTSLGTFGVELNHPQRVSYGSNNYYESAIRQWINSGAAANGWWTPTNKYDRPPTYANVAGLLNGMDSDFLAIIGATDVPCKTNNTFELPNWTLNTAYTVRDKFFLASRDNLGFGTENVAEGSVWTAYANADATDRIKNDFSVHSTARLWWMRSPYPGNAYNARGVDTSGAITNYRAYSGIGAAAACIIY